MAKPSREGGCRWRPPSERPPGRHRAPVPPGSAVPPAPGGSTRQLGGHRLPLRAGQLPLRGAGRFGRSPPAETRSAPRPVHVVARTARSRSSPIAATPLATRSRQWATSSMAAGSAATVAPPCLRLVVRVGGRNGRQIAGQQRRSAGSCGRWELAAGSAVDHADLRPATSWLLDLLAHSLRHLVDLAARSAGEHQHHYRLRTLVFIAGALSAARASGYSLIAWLSAAWAGPPWRVGSRNWVPIGAGLSRGSAAAGRRRWRRTPGGDEGGGSRSAHPGTVQPAYRPGRIASRLGPRVSLGSVAATVTPPRTL